MARLQADVVVIGAGIAGLAASRTLLQLGKSVVTLEAQARTGGRAWTDHTTFHVPFDHGCHYLHDHGCNPWIPYAQEHGFELYPDPDDIHLLAGGGQVASRDLHEQFHQTWGRMLQSVKVGASHGVDVPLSTLLPVSNAWERRISQLLPLWMFGTNASEVSSSDFARATGHGEDWLCRQGFGSVIAHYGRDVPVCLNAAVKRVRWDGAGVAVETARGTVHAKVVIITVSTGVLASQAIAFDPPLPDWKRDAIQQVPMQVCNHIALDFTVDVFGVGADRLVVPVHGGTDDVSITASAGGSSLVLLWTAGDTARRLEAEGHDAAVAFGLETVAGLLGSHVRPQLRRGAATSWGRNPWTRGAFAMAVPGSHGRRNELATPVGDRLFFAGEACHSTYIGSAHGAFATGCNAAAQVARLLDGQSLD